MQPTPSGFMTGQFDVYNPERDMGTPHDYKEQTVDSADD